MGIDDNEVWDYSTAVRDIIESKELRHLKTMRIVDLLDHPHTNSLNREEYLIHAGCYRRELLAKYAPVDFNASEAVRNDKDTTMTYRGYVKFLTKDLMHSRIANETQTQSNPKKKYKEAIEDLAYKMISRGKVRSNPKNDEERSKLMKVFIRHLLLPLRPSVKVVYASQSIHQPDRPSFRCL